jgi:hypothetical protein
MKMVKKPKNCRKKMILVISLFLILFINYSWVESLAYTTSSIGHPEYVPDDDYTLTYGSVDSGSLSDIGSNDGNYWTLSAEYVSPMFEYSCIVEMEFDPDNQGKFDEIDIEVDITGTGNTYYVYVQYTDSTQSSSIGLTDGTTVHTLEKDEDYSSTKFIEGVKIVASKLTSFDLKIDFCKAYEKDGIFVDSYTIHTGSHDSGTVDDTQVVDESVLCFESSSTVINVTLDFSTKARFERIYIYYETKRNFSNDDLEITLVMDDGYEADVSVSTENTYIVLYKVTDFPSTDEVVSIRLYDDKNVNWDLEINYIEGYDYL